MVLGEHVFSIAVHNMCEHRSTILSNYHHCLGLCQVSNKLVDPSIIRGEVGMCYHGEGYQWFLTGCLYLVFSKFHGVAV